MYRHMSIHTYFYWGTLNKNYYLFNVSVYYVPGTFLEAEDQYEYIYNLSGERQKNVIICEESKCSHVNKVKQKHIAGEQ